MPIHLICHQITKPPQTKETNLVNGYGPYFFGSKIYHSVMRNKAEN